MKRFLMGNQVFAQAALDAGMRLMFGYPVTPSSEILETWIGFCQKNPSLDYLQTEDEMAAGFGVIGACLAGVPAFTATAGPGNVLMQDAFSMAEALRIPTVAIINQRGGLSTSTVIYSQEEVRLTCFGGNGEGFRLVFSTSNLQEMYDYTLKASQLAWHYRFPAFILADGYQGKMKGAVQINQKSNQPKSFSPILKKGVNLRNCYNLEEQIGKIIINYSEEYEKIRPEIEEHETYRPEEAQVVLVAHGIVAAAAKPAVDQLRKGGLKAGLFRPITLRPFPVGPAQKALAQSKRIIVLESALGQLSGILKTELYRLIDVPLAEVFKPAVGFTPREIEKAVLKIAA